MATAATARPTHFLDKGFFVGLGLGSASSLKKDGAFKKSTKIKRLKKEKEKEKDASKKASESNSTSHSKDPPSPFYPRLRDLTVEPIAEYQEDPLDSIVCKHCKKPTLRQSAKDHVAGCLKSKQDKARKKKEAREAAQRAKERAERADDDDDDDDDVKDGKRSKSNPDDKSKKRKAEGDDDKPNKKKKKDDQKPKAAKPKGPVDVERQCGVTLPNGQQCARSLTCKSHSMGAKRSVPGRSLPYDMLLAAYQKKNQARQQKAAIDATAAALYDDDLDNITGPIDSDEERDAVMTAITRSIARPQPITTRTLFPTRRKYQLVRLKEVLSNALTGNRSGGLFGVPNDNPRSAYPQSAVEPTFAIPSTTPLTANATLPQQTFRPPSRRESIDVI